MEVVTELPVPSLADVLCGYIDRGWPVLPLWGMKNSHCACPLGDKCDRSQSKHPNGKLCPNGVKNATREKSIVRQWVLSNGNGNWAIRTGEALTGGGFLCVLDLDPRNGSDESLEHVEAQYGVLPETPRAISARGGTHYFFRTDKPMDSHLAGPGLDVLGVGKYVVVAPSVTPDGAYLWDCGADPLETDLAEAPRWMTTGTKPGGTAARPAHEGGSARDTVLGEAFALAEMLGTELPDGSHGVVCPWADSHSDARGRGNDSSTAIFPPAGGSLFGGFRCLHGHCANRKWTDVVAALPSGAVAAARLKFPFRPKLVTASEVEDPVVELEESVVAPRGKLTKAEQQAINVKLSYKTTKGGYKLVNDLVNVTTILTYDPRWKGILVWDSFEQVLKFTRPPPWHEDDVAHSDSSVWTDEDVGRLVSWFKRYWDFDVANDKIVTSVYICGHRDSVNPLQDWLKGLKWDGVKRLDRWLTTYLGVAQTEYSSAVGTMWMVSAIARGLIPGCKADHVLILEGPQGKGKSSALAALAGRDWFSDTPLDIGSKDAYIGLRGKWVLELAELASLNKSAADKAKAFFSSPTDSYRPPYGRVNITIGRTCVFAGSVNHGEYLKDETGNRRYWPVLCHEIDLAGLRRDREQLWAEAKVAYEAGTQWWPSWEVSERVIEPEQLAREVRDSWSTIITEWLQCGQAQEILRKRGYFLMDDFLRYAVKLTDVGHWNHGDTCRVGSVLRQLPGWTRGRLGPGENRAYTYKPSK